MEKSKHALWLSKFKEKQREIIEEIERLEKEIQEAGLKSAGKTKATTAKTFSETAPISSKKH